MFNWKLIYSKDCKAEITCDVLSGILSPISIATYSIDWHPNNVLLACGSTDFKARYCAL